MKYFSVDDQIRIVNSAVLKASMSAVFDAVNQHPEGLFRYKIAKFLGKRKEVYGNYPMGFLYWGLSEYILMYNEKKLISCISEKIAGMFHSDGNLKYKISVVDQVPMGCCFINMYKLTFDNKYKVAAHYIANYLLGRFETDRILYRCHSNVQLVDTLGMIVPFLCMYSELIGDGKYYKIARSVYDDFSTHANTLTGFPVHGYDTTTGIHLGSSNWGRGLGWYLLAKAYLGDKNDSINSLLSSITYVQFPFQGYSIVDSSVALLCELYKVLISSDYVPNFSQLHSFIRQDGLIDFCTGDTCGFNDYASYYGLGGLANGLYLLLLSKSNV